MKKVLITYFIISLTIGCFIGCTANQYNRTDDWYKGYAEGHKDGRWMGYKIKEMETEADNETNRKDN